jgi:hypothetical protein
MITFELHLPMTKRYGCPVFVVLRDGKVIAHYRRVCGRPAAVPRRVYAMSGLCPKADICENGSDVRYNGLMHRNTAGLSLPVFDRNRGIKHDRFLTRARSNSHPNGPIPGLWQIDVISPPHSIRLLNRGAGNRL